MSTLTVFRFDSQDIRFIDGKPVANDVADVLGYADPSKTVSTKVFPENRSVTKLVTVDGKLRDITVLEEAGIYQLIFSSRLETAKQFQQWVFSEVLPSIRKTGSYEIASHSQQPKLPSRVIALETAKAVSEINLLIADENPRLAQFLIDHAISDIMTGEKQLTGTQLRGVVEIAEEMGFAVNMNNRSQLGKFVKSQCKELLKEEQRLVNGTMRNVACYPDCNEVRKAISEYFN